MNQTKLRVKKLEPFSTMHQIEGTISFSSVRVDNYGAMLIVGGAASFLALTIISFAVAIIILALWIGILTLFVYIYVVPQRNSGLLPLYTKAEHPCQTLFTCLVLLFLNFALFGIY